MSPVWLKHMYSVLSALTWRPMHAAARSRLCSRVSAWVGVFARLILKPQTTSSKIVILLIIHFWNNKQLVEVIYNAEVSVILIISFNTYKKYKHLLPCTINVFYRSIGIMIWVFANSLGDRGSISGRVMPKHKKWYLIPFMPNTQHYKVQIKGKVEQSRERSSALLYTSV